MIVFMKETILLFQITDKQTRLKVEMALFPLRVRIRYIEQEELNQPLGALAKIKEIPPKDGLYSGEPLPDSMIVFCGFDDKKLNQALLSLRKCGAGPFPYKAILTPTNQHWTPTECFLELKREHEYMRAKQEFKKE